MDPVTIVGLVEGSISLAVQCGSVAKSLNSLAGHYKHAELTISTMAQNLDIMRLAWDRIRAWFKVLGKDYVPSENDDFTQRLERFLETGFLVLDALEEDLISYDVSKMTFKQRSRLVWNENTLHGHQTRIRDQAQSMSLLLQALRLPSPQAKTILLEQSEKQFMKSDESAFSIVPSRLSSRITLSTGRTGGHDSNSSYESIEYRRLSFEDDLFTARVYKRNYRSSRFQQLWKKESNRDREIVAPKEKRQDKNVGDDPMTLATPKSLTTVPVSWKDVQNPKLSDVTVSTTRSGSPEKIKQGLEYRDSSPVRRLAGACGRGDIDTVKSLLEITDVPEKLINEHCHQQFVCPIHATVLNGHVEVMETILQYVVGWALGYMMFCPRGPPIHLAAINEDLAMVQLLLGKTTSVSVRTNSGIQAVHLAAKTGSMEVLAALIDAGADVNCADRDGRQPLHYISESQDRPDVIKYLIKRGASPSGLHPLSVPTPLYLARENNFTGNVEILRTLKDDYLLALDTAIRDGSPSSVGTLIRKGGDPNRCRSDGGTGLHTFVLGLYTNVPRDKSTNRRILRLLLDHVDLLAETDYGNGFTVLDSLFHLGGKTDEVATLKLARLFRDNLPEHKSREDHILRCMMREKKP